MAERVLVTGGGGFVAGWCIVELLNRGYDVRATLRNPAKQAATRAAIASVADAGDRLTFAIADLTRDDGWNAAAAGCDFALHVASPLGTHAPGDAQALIGPARDGTLRVLRAASRAGVKRVVMTSAAAAARAQHGGECVSDESVWPDPGRKTDPYRLSKILAERAAWDFMAEHVGPTALTTVLPAAVFGPVLTRDNLGSVQVIQRLLQGKPPAIPRLGFSIVDVRDLAALQVRAMTAPQAAGQRFIAAGDFMWMTEIASTLRAALGAQAMKVPTRGMPDFVFKLLALALPQLRMLVADLGRMNKPTADKARRILAFSPRPATATVLDCARSLLAG